MMKWRLLTVDTWQYHEMSDDQFVTFTLGDGLDSRQEMTVILPWTGDLITILDSLEKEAKKRIKDRVGGDG